MNATNTVLCYKKVKQDCIFGKDTKNYSCFEKLYIIKVITLKFYKNIVFFE